MSEKWPIATKCCCFGCQLSLRSSLHWRPCAPHFIASAPGLREPPPHFLVTPLQLYRRPVISHGPVTRRCMAPGDETRCTVSLVHRLSTRHCPRSLLDTALRRRCARRPQAVDNSRPRVAQQQTRRTPLLPNDGTDRQTDGLTVARQFLSHAVRAVRR